MSDVFGDIDPEDAYDGGDPPVMRLDVLERVVDALEFTDNDGRHDARRVDALRLVTRLELEPGVDRVRLAVIRDRLEAL